MILSQNPCHECCKSIPFEIEQTVINNKLRWYISYNCPFCGSSMQFDEIGFPPEDIRQKILTEEGEWEIKIENFDRQKQKIFKSLRKILNISTVELYQKIKSINTNNFTLYSGTKCEMEWLFSQLQSDGIESLYLQIKI